MPLVILAAAWVAGLLIGLNVGGYVPALALFSVAALSLTYLLRACGVSIWPALLALVLLMGVLRVEVSERPEGLIPSDARDSISIRGLVDVDPELSGPGVEFVVSIEEADTGSGWENSRGKVLVTARPSVELVQRRDEPYFRYGDRLELTGRLQLPPELGGFDYAAYLATQGIGSVMRFPQSRLLAEGEGKPALERIYDLRRQVSKGLDTALPEPQSALAQALLLGLRGSLPADVKEDFRATGTSHMLAISGLHVGVLLLLSLGASAWLMGKRRQLYLLVPLSTIWLYAVLSGFSAPVERAAIMGSVYILGLALGRPRGILPALALAAAVMAGLEPQILERTSFQLSFAAMAGIAMLAQSEPPLWTQFAQLATGGPGWWRVLARVLVASFLVSLVATIATLPLIAFYFQRIPTVGIPATVLVLPALPVLLVTSAAAAVAGLISSTLGQVVGWLAWVPSQYILQLIRLIAQVPGSTISVASFSGIAVWAYYGVLALLLLAPTTPLGLWRSLRRRLETLRLPRIHRIDAGTIPRLPVGGYLGLVVTLAALAGVLWFQVASGHDGRLHVYFLDVGQGDSTLIVTPEGKRVLVDGGPGPLDAVRAASERSPFWDRSLDLVVLTHPDEDHFRGLIEVLDRYRVDTVLETDTSGRSPMFAAWRERLDEKAARRVTAYRGETISLDKYTWMEVLSPPQEPFRGTGADVNNNGVVLRLVYGGVSFLLAADIEAEAEHRLVSGGAGVRSTVLKVAHHGSKTSTTSRFLDAVQPVAAVISAGEDNAHGHPHAEVMTRLASSIGGARVFQTQERGDIEFTTDGERLWVSTER